MNYYNHQPSMVDHEYEEACQLEAAHEEAFIDIVNTLLADEPVKFLGASHTCEQLLFDRLNLTDDELNSYIDGQKADNFIEPDAYQDGC